MAREIDGADAIEAGDQIRVEYDDEPTVEELHCGVSWCGGVPTYPTGNCVQHQDREPNPAWRGDREEVTGDADVVEVLDDD